MKHCFDLIVLGAGSGGLAAAKRAASYGAKVAIVEGDLVGGTCVIRGCVPKKLLVYGSHFWSSLANASGFGIEINKFKKDSGVLLENVRQEVNRLNRLHIDLLEKANVQLIRGWGKFSSPNSIVVTNQENKIFEISAHKILIAVGGRPIRPSIDGAAIGFVSDDLFLQKVLPKKFIVIGGGFIACEISCILSALGVSVTQLVRGNCLLRGFDKEVCLMLQNDMQSKGIDIKFDQDLVSLIKQKDDMILTNLNGITFKSNAVLFATGRKPFLEGLELGKSGIKIVENKIKVDIKNKTNVDNIYAVGDVTDRVNLTPVAIEEGRVFADNCFGNKNRIVDYNFIPKAVFSQPEISFVGETEEEAILNYGEENIDIYRSKFRPMSEMIQKSDSKCFLKLIVHKHSQKIIGCHMLGEHASEIIQMAAISIKMGAKKIDFDETMALHPTIAEEFVTMM